MWSVWGVECKCKVYSVKCMPHKTTFDTFAGTRECQDVTRVLSKTTLQPASTPSYRFCNFPMDRHGEARRKPETRDETRWSIKTSISCETSSNFHTVASKSTYPTSFLMSLKICYLKIDVSCEASVNFQHISQNATPATQFAPCRHLTQP